MLRPPVTVRVFNFVAVATVVDAPVLLRLQRQVSHHGVVARRRGDALDHRIQGALLLGRAVADEQAFTVDVVLVTAEGQVDPARGRQRSALTPGALGHGQGQSGGLGRRAAIRPQGHPELQLVPDLDPQLLGRAVLPAVNRDLELGDVQLVELGLRRGPEGDVVDGHLLELVVDQRVRGAGDVEGRLDCDVSSGPPTGWTG